MSDTIKVFVSHDHDDDAALAQAVVDFLQGAVEIPDRAIRCTSLPRCALPNGAATGPTLLEELRAAPVCIAVVTPNSRRQDWVLFEIGARWALDAHLVALLPPYVDFDIIPKPVQERIALKLSDRPRLLRLAEEVAEKTQLRRREVAQVVDAADTLVSYAKTLRPPATPPALPATHRTQQGPRPEMVRGLVRKFAGCPEHSVSLRIREILDMGGYQTTLSIVFDEQEREVIEYLRDRQRSYTDPVIAFGRWIHLVTDIVAKDRDASEPVIEAFAAKLFKEFQTLRTPDASVLHHIQTDLLAWEIDKAYGQSGIPLLQRIVLAQEYAESPLLQLLLKRTNGL